jgi:hypothetical protein
MCGVGHVAAVSVVAIRIITSPKSPSVCRSAVTETLLDFVPAGRTTARLQIVKPAEAQASRGNWGRETGAVLS